MTLLAGAGALVAGAVVCLSAHGIVALVIGRLALAAGSGATSAAALVLASSSTPEQRPKVLASFGATIAVFSAGATLAGGVVTQWLSRLAAPGGALIAASALLSAVLLGLAGLIDSSVLVICGVSLGFAAFASTQVVATGLLSARIRPAQRGGGLALLNLTFFVGGGAGSAVAGHSQVVRPDHGDRVDRHLPAAGWPRRPHAAPPAGTRCGNDR